MITSSPKACAMLPALLAALLATTLAAQESAPSSAASAWVEDLDHLARELPRRHKNAFSVLSEATFRTKVAALRARLPHLDDDHAEAALMQLVAAIGDSHTMVQPKNLASRTLPLRLTAWPDGVRVLGIGKPHAALLGARLVAIEGTPYAEVAARVASVRAYDNAGSRDSSVPAWTTLPRLLRALDLVKSADEVAFEFEGADGKRTALALRPGALGSDAVFERPKASTTTLQRGALWHHFEWLAADGIAYVQYNRCATDAAHDLGAFTEKVKEATAKEDVKAWVFDLQYNGGGNSALGDLMFARLVPKGARVFCIIGPQTFSSGMLNAMALRTRYGATLLGRPTGGKPSHFGEVKSFELPRSKLSVQYSTKYWQHGDAKADALEPDVTVVRTRAEYLEGKDPFVEALREALKSVK